MAAITDGQRHSHRRRRISRPALELQRHLPRQHRARFRFPRSPARPCRSFSLQRDRDVDAHVLNESPSTKSQAPGKFQYSNSKTKIHAPGLEFDAWSLVLLWNLGLGVWSF